MRATSSRGEPVAGDMPSELVSVVGYCFRRTNLGHQDLSGEAEFGEVSTVPGRSPDFATVSSGTHNGTQRKTGRTPGGAFSQFRRGGQGRDRTGDLPLFRRTLVPTELPGLKREAGPNSLGLRGAWTRPTFGDPDGT